MVYFCILASLAIVLCLGVIAVRYCTLEDNFRGETEIDPSMLPDLNTVWQHTSGRFYKVLHIANKPNDGRYPCTIVYQGTDGEVWARRATDWHRSMVLFNPPE